MSAKWTGVSGIIDALVFFLEDFDSPFSGEPPDEWGRDHCDSGDENDNDGSGEVGA